MTHSSGSTQKITVNLPRPLIQRLRQQIPARQRAEFVAQALEDRLALAGQVEALAETAGAWRDADHPDGWNVLMKEDGARLVKSDWNFAGRKGESRRTITASVTKSGYEKMTANWLYKDFDLPKL